MSTLSLFLKHHSRVLQLCGTALLLSYAVFSVDLGALGAALKNARFFWLPLLIPLLVLDRMIAAARIWLLLHKTKIYLSYSDVLTKSLIGIYFGYFVPSSFGVDAVTGYLLGSNGKGVTKALTVIFFDRMMSFFITVCCGVLILSLWFSETFRLIVPQPTVKGAVVGMVVVSIIIICMRITKKHAHRIVLLEKIKKIFLKSKEALSMLAHAPVVIGLNFILALLLFIVRVAHLVVLAIIFKVAVPWYILAFAASASTIILVIPISIGGLGFREATFVGLFSMLGYAEVEGLILSIGLTTLDMLLVVLGGMFFSFRKRHEQFAN